MGVKPRTRKDVGLGSRRQSREIEPPTVHVHSSQDERVPCEALRGVAHREPQRHFRLLEKPWPRSGKENVRSAHRTARNDRGEGAFPSRARESGLLRCLRPMEDALDRARRATGHADARKAAVLVDRYVDSSHEIARGRNARSTTGRQRVTGLAVARRGEQPRAHDGGLHVMAELSRESVPAPKRNRRDT